MLKLGLVRQSCPGVYHLLPLALRSLEKLVALIDNEMKAIGAAKMAMPILTPATLWKKTGGFKFLPSTAVGGRKFVNDCIGNMATFMVTHRRLKCFCSTGLVKFVSYNYIIQNT